MAVRPLAEELYSQLIFGKCSTWSTCFTDYVKEARKRADCIGYTLGAEEEGDFKFLFIISDWVDSGEVGCEEGLIGIMNPH